MIKIINIKDWDSTMIKLSLNWFENVTIANIKWKCDYYKYKVLRLHNSSTTSYLYFLIF